MKVALFLKKLGFSSTLMHSLGVASIGGAVSLWGRSAAKSDKNAQARAERLAIFVGLWPPTFFLLGKVLQDLEATPDEQVGQARMKLVAQRTTEHMPVTGKTFATWGEGFSWTGPGGAWFNLQQ